MRSSLSACALLVLACGVLATDASSQVVDPGARSESSPSRLAKRVGQRVVERLADKHAGRRVERRDDRRRAAQDLGITQAQKDLLKETRHQHAAALKDARSAAASARRSLHETARQPQLDEASLGASGQQFAAAARALAEQRNAARADAQRILTPQQSAGLEALRAERKAERAAKRTERDERKARHAASRGQGKSRR